MKVAKVATDLSIAPIPKLPMHMNILIHDAPIGRFLEGTSVDKNLHWRGNYIEEIYKSIHRAGDIEIYSSSSPCAVMF